MNRNWIILLGLALSSGCTTPPSGTVLLPGRYPITLRPYQEWTHPTNAVVDVGLCGLTTFECHGPRRETEWMTLCDPVAGYGSVWMTRTNGQRVILSVRVEGTSVEVTVEAGSKWKTISTMNDQGELVPKQRVEPTK